MPMLFAVRSLTPSMLLAALLAGGGCQSTKSITPQRPAGRVQFPHVDAATVDARDPRQLQVYDGRSGQSTTWSAMLDRLDAADVIIIGEQHDDGQGHATQLAIVQDVARERPGRGALALEMLERDDQLLTDEYLTGLIDAPAFAKQTQSESWAGEGSWKKWYQPTIDAAAGQGWCVIAANAPRRYVRLSHDAGYTELTSLNSRQRELFAIPMTWPLDYRQRFVDVMAGSDGDDEGDEDASPTTAPATQPHPAATHPATTHPATSAPASPHGPLKPENIDAALRSQLLWDSTMADSIVRAHRAGCEPVIHLEGQFHCDFTGGTVQELRARLGKNARIVTVSLQRRTGDTFRTSDRDRADYIIYTGKRPPESKPAE